MADIVAPCLWLPDSDLVINCGPAERTLGVAKDKLDVPEIAGGGPGILIILGGAGGKRIGILGGGRPGGRSGLPGGGPGGNL